MSELETAYQEAHQKMPTKWYESRDVARNVFFSIFILTAFLYELSPTELKQYLPFIATLTYIVTCVRDKLTTEDFFSNIASNSQLLAFFREENAFISDHPSKEELYQFKSIFLDILTTAFIPLYPPLGAAAASYRYIASKNNQRKLERAESLMSTGASEEVLSSCDDLEIAD